MVVNMAEIPQHCAERFFAFVPKRINPATYMGYPIPLNVAHIDTMYIAHQDATLIRWKNKDGSTHEMEFLHPLELEYITVLLVTMRLSC